MIRIKPFEIHSVVTGRFRLDGGAMFGVVPKVLWADKVDVDDRNRILLAMRTLLAVDRDAGTERTDRSRYLASKAALVLAERTYERFADLQLTQPFEESLNEKQNRLMRMQKGLGHPHSSDYNEV